MTLPIVESEYIAEHVANPAVAICDVSTFLPKIRSRPTSTKLPLDTLCTKPAFSRTTLPSLPNVMPKTGSPGAMVVTAAPTLSTVPKNSPPAGWREWPFETESPSYGYISGMFIFSKKWPTIWPSRSDWTLIWQLSSSNFSTKRCPSSRWAVSRAAGFSSANWKTVSWRSSSCASLFSIPCVASLSSSSVVKRETWIRPPSALNSASPSGEWLSASSSSFSKSSNVSSRGTVASSSMSAVRNFKDFDSVLSALTKPVIIAYSGFLPAAKLPLVTHKEELAVSIFCLRQSHSSSVTLVNIGSSISVRKIALLCCRSLDATSGRSWTEYCRAVRNSASSDTKVEGRFL